MMVLKGNKSGDASTWPSKTEGGIKWLQREEEWEAVLLSQPDFAIIYHRECEPLQLCTILRIYDVVGVNLK